MSAAAGEVIRLTLYGRRYCHLCEDMQAALADLAAEFEFVLDVVDVDEAEALETRYGERVPVLAHGEIELCHYFLDRIAVSQYLAASARATANAAAFR
jgi:thioredoxin reductase (NADPH)